MFSEAGSLRHALYVVPVLVALWYLDSTVSKERTVGWERNGVRDARKRWSTGRGREAVLLGSSTSVDWLRPGHVERLLRLPGGSVVDAHINGCHQGCTFAEVRRLLHEKRHYRRAFYGTNQFQICEFEHSKRVLQQEMMIPTEDVPDLFSLYLHADQPLGYMARFVGMRLSGVYGDTLFLQGEWSEAVFGEPRKGRQHLWYSEKGPPAAPWPWCDYEAGRVAYKVAVSRALFRDLRRLADQVIVMLLPDENLSREDPEIEAAWDKHRALHRRMVSELPGVTLVDLSRPGGARKPGHFKDGFHVNVEGARLQQALLEKELRGAGVLPR